MNTYLNKHFAETYCDDLKFYQEQSDDLAKEPKRKFVQLSFVNFPDLKTNNYDYGTLDMANETMSQDILYWTRMKHNYIKKRKMQKGVKGTMRGMLGKLGKLNINIDKNSDDGDKSDSDEENNLIDAEEPKMKLDESMEV